MGWPGAHRRRLTATLHSSPPSLPACLPAPLPAPLPRLQFFITADRPNVAGLVLAGSADFKTELSQSDLFDPRLQAVVLAVVDVSYGELRRGGEGLAVGWWWVDSGLVESRAGKVEGRGQGLGCGKGGGACLLHSHGCVPR